MERIHRIADLPREPEVRATMSDALELILELIADRMGRRDVEDQWDRPTDGG